VARAYREAFLALAGAITEDSLLAVLPDAWQALLVNLLLDDVNPWSRQAEQHGERGVSPAFRQQAQRDLRALQRLFQLPAETLWQWTHEVVASVFPALEDAWVPWYELASPDREEQRSPARESLCQYIAACSDWAMLVEPMTRYWARYGTGHFTRFSVLRWQGREQGLQGVAAPDSIRLANLIGYEREQTLLKANLERFLAGLPAHDAVLYGAPGTGKSATVKALANEYAEQGLRLIEVSREHLGDLPTVVALLRSHAPRFLLFIDDLSFEEHETEYKALKVLLEGTAEARPPNLLIHATTNRLNLIRELFSDRGKPTDDIHWRDTMEEKSSLIARFGLRVTFMRPDQEGYLTIATELARQRGLSIPEQELRSRALSWERQHTGRSGRLARQFIDDLEAELGKT
jgi:predicted AAA+ superfamily ATPase